jgi:E3 ubiquitin-protein ligase RNF13
LPFNISTHLLLPFAIVVGICFLIMVIFMVSLQSVRIYIFQ